MEKNNSPLRSSTISPEAPISPKQQFSAQVRAVHSLVAEAVIAQRCRLAKVLDTSDLASDIHDFVSPYSRRSGLPVPIVASEISLPSKAAELLNQNISTFCSFEGESDFEQSAVLCG